MVPDGAVMDSSQHFGAHLRVLRTSAGLSQEDLAGAALLSKDTVSRIERGATSPRAETLLRLADALGVSADAFFDTVEAASTDTPERLNLRMQLNDKLVELDVEDLQLLMQVAERLKR
jgi:transcriptional regulator with XRE-family HTH domain